MKWFRRAPDDFDVDWELRDSRWAPKFPQPFPTPWRDHPRAADCFLLPRELCYFFADEGKMNNMERQEPEKIEELRASIAVEGLKVPLQMTWDSEGKIRYHDGHHRMTAMRPLDEPRLVPVWFKRSQRIKSYCKAPEHYIEVLFTALDRAITTA